MTKYKKRSFLDNLLEIPLIEIITIVVILLSALGLLLIPKEILYKISIVPLFSIL